MLCHWNGLRAGALSRSHRGGTAVKAGVLGAFNGGWLRMCMKATANVTLKTGRIANEAQMKSRSVWLGDLFFFSCREAMRMNPGASRTKSRETISPKGDPVRSTDL